MSTELPVKPRAGKYCPRCHAMSPPSQAVCSQCGHQFRTGIAAAAAPTPEPDALHRTMQFVLPPLTTRLPASVLLEPPTLRRVNSRLFAMIGAALMVCFGAALFLFIHSRLAAANALPTGDWETTLRSKSSSEAHLEFAFQTGGTGSFSWRETGSAALSGQTPLVWRQNPDQTLTLALAKPADGDPVSQTLAGIFSSHPWPWHVDPTPRRLTLGTLVFTEKL